MLSLQKNFSLTFSLFTPRFFIRKFVSIAELFLEEGWGSLLKRTYVEWVHVKRAGTNKEAEGGQKLEISSERTF